MGITSKNSHGRQQTINLINLGKNLMTMVGVVVVVEPRHRIVLNVEYNNVFVYRPGTFHGIGGSNFNLVDSP